MQTINKEEVLKVFKQIYEIQENVKDYNSTISDFKKVLADNLQVTPDIISKSYAQWKLLIEHPDKLGDIDELLEAIR